MQIEAGSIKVSQYIIRAIDDVNAASTSQEIPIQLPGYGGYLLHLFAKVNVAFAGVTLPKASIGHADDTDAYMTAQRLDSIKKLVPGGMVGSQFACAKMDTIMHGMETPRLRVRITSSSGNLSSLTAGELEIMAVYAV